MFRTIALIAALLFTTLVRAQDPLDVTLVFAADPEIGMTGRGMTEQIARNHAKAIQNLLGTNGQRLVWPAGTSRPGGTIDALKSVFVAGDLAADNTIREGSESWKLLSTLYVDPDRVVKAPVYLGWGNHDVYAHNWWFPPQGSTNNNSSATLMRKTQDDVVAKFDQGFGVLASTPPHYAVRKGRLLVVQLNTSLGEPCRKSNFIGAPSWYDMGVYGESSDSSCNAQQWLRDTLEEHKRVHGANAPVILTQHYGYDGFGMGGGGYRGYWWHPDARDALAEIIGTANVIGFFHGHTHADLFTPKGTVYRDQPVFRGSVASPKLDVGYPRGRAWADYDGDGTNDYCRVTDSDGGEGKIRCRRFDGKMFAATDVISGKLDVGYAEGRGWPDVDGDRRADYCRVTGSKNWGTQTIRCALAKNGFGSEISGTLDVGFAGSGRIWADFNGDGKADYCRVVDRDSGNGKVRCALSTGSGFGPDVESGTLDVGYWQGRAFTDVNADGKADYCRVTTGNVGSGAIACTLSKGDSFGETIAVKLDDVGFFEGRAWADVNNDKRADYCRATGTNHAIAAVRCRLSLGTSFDDKDMTSPTAEGHTAGIDIGYLGSRTWTDFNADGSADYCRVVMDGRAECTPALNGGFPADFSYRSLPLESSFDDNGRFFVDVNNDRRADYCRVIDSNSGEGRVACTFAAAATTVTPVDSYGVHAGYCDGGFTVVRVTDTHLDVVPVRKTSEHCKDAEYDGSVTVNTELVRSTPIRTQ